MIVAKHGMVGWLKGRPQISYLPGYDQTAETAKSKLTFKQARRAADMLYWLIENNVEGWSHTSIQIGYGYEHIFYFRNTGDYALARLAA